MAIGHSWHISPPLACFGRFVPITFIILHRYGGSLPNVNQIAGGVGGVGGVPSSDVPQSAASVSGDHISLSPLLQP